MHNKNNNKTSTFIQGLRPFSRSIPKTLKKHIRKGSFNYSNIVDNWTRIVSKNISDHCYPIMVKMGKDMKDGILSLNVIHGKEMEIEYEKNNIKDKVNSFFGYNCIGDIKLKIVQEKIKGKPIFFPKLKSLNKIEKKIDNINDDQLKKTLNSFLKAYNERNK